MGCYRVDATRWWRGCCGVSTLTNTLRLYARPYWMATQPDGKTRTSGFELDTADTAGRNQQTVLAEGEPSTFQRNDHYSQDKLPPNALYDAASNSCYLNSTSYDFDVVKRRVLWIESKRREAQVGRHHAQIGTLQGGNTSPHHSSALEITKMVTPHLAHEDPCPAWNSTPAVPTLGPSDRSERRMPAYQLARLPLGGSEKRQSAITPPKVESGPAFCQRREPIHCEPDARSLALSPVANQAKSRLLKVASITEFVLHKLRERAGDHWTRLRLGAAELQSRLPAAALCSDAAGEQVSSIVASSSLLALASAQATKSPVIASNGTVLAVFMYHNHCDRTSLYNTQGSYTGGSFGAAGATMCFTDGMFYWNKYLKADSDLKIYGTTQIYNQDYVNVEVPNVDIAIQSATSFMQGVFKPVDMASTVTSGPDMLAADNSTFMNGPLSGYQYTPVTTYRSTDPQSVYLASTLLQCNNQRLSTDLYYGSEDYKNAYLESIDFLNSLYEPYFAGVFTKDQIIYYNSYILYDYVNQNRLAGNETLLEMSDSDFQQLRVYANRLQFNLYANTTISTLPDWADDQYDLRRREVGGRALAGKVSRMFRDSITSGGFQNRFNFVLGDYDLMLSFFAIANLTSRSDDFFGLPDLGSSMVFELYTDDPTLTIDGQLDPTSVKVAFGFRNGTTVDDTLTYWPLFDENSDGNSVSMLYDRFIEKMDAAAVSNVGQWCSVCNAQVDFCTAESVSGGTNFPQPSGSQRGSNNSKGMSPAVAGIIGAIIMLAIVGIIAAIAFFLFGIGVRRERRRSSILSSISRKEKMSSDIELPLSPTAAPMPRAFDDNEFDYGTASTAGTKVASPLASPEEAHFKT
ncbi:hypothetical protein Dda_1083 [Drechslerella dactyloides]|uniref:Histidine acid phosphatase n=1 Tax=Drechslerella dactyloides TaxID=74499 RepID=A0AAD6J7C4_DREDA|nr:hypothetical protein Dda_1083 [Drechslerella dactyloides]